MDLITVKGLLGHPDIKITTRYAHSAPEQKIRAVALLENASEKSVDNFRTPGPKCRKQQYP
jgi:hypothetical protein